jgi:hypothetical protein
MPALLATGRHPVRQGFTIQVMEEAIARCHRPVRPFNEAACLNKLVVSGQATDFQSLEMLLAFMARVLRAERERSAAQ